MAGAVAERVVVMARGGAAPRGMAPTAEPAAMLVMALRAVVQMVAASRVVTPRAVASTVAGQMVPVASPVAGQMVPVA